MVFALPIFSGLWFPKEMTTQLLHEVALLNATVDVISCGFNLDGSCQDNNSFGVRLK